MQTKLSLQQSSHQDEKVGGIDCEICPHYCSLLPGETGRCQVRKRVGDKIELTMYGKCSILAVEPIEKRPFFHFDMGGKYLAVGFYGCSMACAFCQNYTVSQTVDGKSKTMMPEDLVSLAKSKDTNGIAFTFNEPTIYYEYVMDVATFDPLFPIIMKTNGFVNENILFDLSYVVSAFNIDIKGDEQEYQSICGASLKPVINTVEFLWSMQKHIEISYLVTPRLINDMSYHNDMLSWLSDIPEVPIHFLYFYPFHRMAGESYGVQDLIPLIEMFKTKMNHVYVSNLFDDRVLKYRDTFCPECNSLMVSRNRSVEIIKRSCCSFSLEKETEEDIS